MSRKAADLIALSFFMLISATNLAHAAEDAACDKAGFSNVYYLVDVSDIAAVSGFFRAMGESNYFAGILDFAAVPGHRRVRESYFDFEDLTLAEKGQELFYSVQENLPVYRADKERIFYKDNLNDQNSSSFEVKKYNHEITPLDKHPLFGRIKRSQRTALIKTLRQYTGLSPGNITLSLEVEHDEIVYLLMNYYVGYGEIALDQFHINNYGVPNTYAVLKFNIYGDSNEVVQLSEGQKRELKTVLCRISHEFQQRFPDIKAASIFGYSDYLRLAAKDLPIRHLLHKYPALFAIGQILSLSFIGFLLVYLILGRYVKGRIYRFVSRKGQVKQ